MRKRIILQVRKNNVNKQDKVLDWCRQKGWNEGGQEHNDRDDSLK